MQSKQAVAGAGLLMVRHAVGFGLSALTVL